MRRLKRRGFLRTSALAVGALAGGAVSSRASRAWSRALGANERVRVAVLGVRGRGRGHVRGFSEIDGVEIAAVCDPDSGVLERGAREARGQEKEPDRIGDFRRVLDDRSIQAITVATPDHWHALATIWGCQAGKDVYVEKPCSHNPREGRRMVEAARKHGRVVQHGTQSRSGEQFATALEELRSGGIGTVRMAKVINSQRRADIGHRKDAPVPVGVDFDLWLGPAPVRPFNPNRFHYNWHWQWDYGTGDLGNDGAHGIDYARWLLGVEDPITITASGRKLHFDDDQETPDTQTVVYRFETVDLVYEMRIWTPYGEHGIENGAVFYGTDGYLELSPHGWRLYGEKNRPVKTQPGAPRQEQHFRNFIECMRTRARPNADIEEGYLSSRLCHLGNIATRVGRTLHFDARTEELRDDPEASRLLGREYREPFVVPESV